MRSVTKVEADQLEVFTSREEIKEAMWDCEPSKAPRVDGYNLNFIKKIVGGNWR